MTVNVTAANASVLVPGTLLTLPFQLTATGVEAPTFVTHTLRLQ